MWDFLGFSISSSLAKVMADSIVHVQGGWKDVSLIPRSYNMSHFLYRQLSI